MDTAISRRLMTFDDFKEKIGREPQEDKTTDIPLFGPITYKMSKKYKAIETAMGSVAAEQARTTQIQAGKLDETGWQTLQQKLDGDLQAVVKAAETYRSGKKKEKKGAADELKAEATAAKTALPKHIAAIRTDPGFDGVKNHLTVEQVFEAKRLGINFTDCQFDLYNDSNLDKNRSKANAGAGKMNSVSKVVHADGKERVFKPEQAFDPGGAKVTGEVGIDPQAPHFGNRNIASKAIADALGTEVIPEACFALHQGKIGLLMAKAPGEAPLKGVTGPVDPSKDGFFRTELGKAKRDAGEDGEPDYSVLESKGYRQKGDGWERTEKKGVKPWSTPPSKAAQASLHSQLNQLEWCDLMTGQADRTSENYMIEIVGDQVKVTGIDNDLSFGEKSTTAAPPPEFTGFTSAGLPPLIDSNTFKRIVAIDFDNDLLPRLTGLLTKAEIDASRQRFADVRKHALALQQKNMVVQDWATWTTPDGQMNASQFLAAQGKGSLFGRDLVGFFKQDGLL
jgi:hypothetical protein